MYAYEQHARENNYKAAMNIIANANKELFWEVGNRCEALKEIFGEILKEELEQKMEEKMKEKMNAGRGTYNGIIRITENKKNLS